MRSYIASAVTDQCVRDAREGQSCNLVHLNNQDTSRGLCSWIKGLFWQSSVLTSLCKVDCPSREKQVTVVLPSRRRHLSIATVIRTMCIDKDQIPTSRRCKLIYSRLAWYNQEPRSCSFRLRQSSFQLWAQLYTRCNQATYHSLRHLKGKVFLVNHIFLILSNHLNFLF